MTSETYEIQSIKAYTALFSRHNCTLRAQCLLSSRIKQSD